MYERRNGLSRTAGPSLGWAGQSDVGCVRGENQDAIRLPAPGWGGPGLPLFILADGMGGMNGGSIASGLAVETALASFAAEQARGAQAALGRAFGQASQAILRRALQEPELAGMGTTLVALTVEDGQAVIANVGDSRCYRFRQGLLEQISLDHSLVQEQVRLGAITPEQAKTHHLRNVLTRAVGVREEADPDIFRERLRVGDLFLLCSDGLHGFVEETEIAGLLSRGGGEEAQAVGLIEAARRAGAPDNVSVVLVRVASLDDADPAEATTAEMKGSEPVRPSPREEDPRPSRTRLLVLLSLLAWVVAALVASHWYLYR